MHAQRSIKLLSVAAIGLAFAAGPAHAQFFVGGTVGQGSASSYDFDSGDTVTRNDDSDTAFHIFAGWRFTDYLAVTAGYAELGELSVAADFGEGESFTDDISASAFDLSVLGILPFSAFDTGEGFVSRMGLFAHVGVSFWDQDIDYFDTIEGAWKGGESGNGFVWGLGVNAGVTENLGIHVRYWSYPDIGDKNSPKSGHEQDFDGYGIGVTWRFGDM